MWAVCGYQKHEAPGCSLNYGHVNAMPKESDQHQLKAYRPIWGNITIKYVSVEEGYKYLGILQTHSNKQAKVKKQDHELVPEASQANSEVQTEWT
jgi:hypothetical protein